MKFSVLDLAPIVHGSTAARALANCVDLARHAEKWGYHRFWVAEHHNMRGLACAATPVVISHVAHHTRAIRVGSGGVMLPNHTPLVVAEQFGTLETLFPGRIDLGLGRAPGTDPWTSRALRRNVQGIAEQFPDDVRELLAYFDPPEDARVRAIPGEGLDVPVYLLGSSDFTARLAAELGLPFGFASHFAPDYLHHALELYRASYRPSEKWPEPYVMVGVNVFCAATDAEARRLFTSVQQSVLSLVRGRPRRLPEPVDEIEWLPEERQIVDGMLRVSAVGSPATVEGELRALVAEHRPDELIVVAHIHDHAARLRSFELAAGVLAKLGA